MDKKSLFTADYSALSSNKSFSARHRQVILFVLQFEAVLLLGAAINNTVITRHIAIAILEFFLALMAFALFLAVRQNRFIRLAAWSASSMVALVIIYVIIYAQGSMGTFSLILLYPLVSYALLGLRYGLLVNLLYTVILLVILFYGFTHWNIHRPAETLLNTITALLAGGIILYYFESVRQQTLHKLFQSSITDELTGLWNRKMFDRTLKNEIAYSKRHNTPLSMIIFDLDFFKHVNDHYGHNAGDKVLQEFAQLLKSRIRQEDHLARWGGEEFALILPNTNIEGATSMVKTLLQSVRKHNSARSGK